MTRSEFSAELARLIAAGREGISDQDIAQLMREATDALVLVPVPTPISRIVRSRSKKAPPPTQPSRRQPWFGVGRSGGGGRGPRTVTMTENGCDRQIVDGHWRVVRIRRIRRMAGKRRGQAVMLVHVIS